MASLTEQLFGSSTADEKKSIDFNTKKKTELDIFAVAPQVRKESRREKRRRLEALEGSKITEGKSILDNIVLVPKEEKENDFVRKPKHLRHGIDTNTDEDRRTVFVGNVPNTVDKKALQKAFKDCGEIDSIRIRNQVLEPEDEKKRGRAVRVLRGDVKKDEKLSAVCYVLFKKTDAVPKAIEKTGLVIQGRHIFVTRVDDDSKSFPPSTSVFLGNLSYDTNEEDIWTFFAEYGVTDLRRVRIVRDKETGQGKGFAYVEFSKNETVSKAIATRGNQLNGREVRICHVTKDQKTAGKKALRRDQRKQLNSKATQLGPAAKGSRKTKVVKGDEEDRPSWMGLATNPRKKLARDLRPLVTDSGVNKKNAKKSGAPAPKKKPQPKPSS
mmetsp:Transcript_39755/g.46277  ORF Transcript_39755/g.46277 Transcript_39755/m.46277 type:complete len:383 (-) Transcript_39755:65-1213(-)